MNRSGGAKYDFYLCRTTHFSIEAIRRTTQVREVAFALRRCVAVVTAACTLHHARALGRLPLSLSPACTAPPLRARASL